MNPIENIRSLLKDYIIIILTDWIEKKFYNIWQNHTKMV